MPSEQVSTRPAHFLVGHPCLPRGRPRTLTLGVQFMLPRTSHVSGLVSVTALLAGCGWASCGHLAAEKARKLDPAYLSQLYAYAASSECKGTCRPSILSGLNGIGNRPPVFEVLPRRMAQVKLSVCMDSGAILSFKEVGTPQGVIYISWSSDGIQWERSILWSVNPQIDSSQSDRR